MEPIEQIAGVDRDIRRRPGYRANRPPAPWPWSREPPARQEGIPSTPRHGRPGKEMTPVFSTAVPLRGLSGRVRRVAYTFPDHQARHWVLLLLANRIDAAGPRLRRLLLWSLPVAVAAVPATAAVRRRGAKAA